MNLKILNEIKHTLSQLDKVAVCIVLIGLLILVFINLGICYFESQTFNKLTGANTTFFDAIWVELRVDCNNLMEK